MVSRKDTAQGLAVAAGRGADQQAHSVAALHEQLLRERRHRHLHLISEDFQLMRLAARDG